MTDFNVESIKVDNYLLLGWVRVILPPVRTNHRKEIRVRMIDRDHSLRKGGIKIDVWQMRKLEQL